MNILAVTSGRGKSAQRVRAMEELGHKVTHIKSERPVAENGLVKRPSFKEKVFSRLGRPIDINGVNAQIVEAVNRSQFDLLWDEKVLPIKPKTLKKAIGIQPEMSVVFFSEDDMFAKWNQSVYFKASIPLFNVIFTTKSFNANPEELPSLGAQRVEFIQKSYDPATHRPVDLTPADHEQYDSDVSFIGVFEEHRANMLYELARSGTKVRVWGDRWERFSKAHPNLDIAYRVVNGSDYAKAICGSKIALCFLRRLNRDLQTGRSVEIPACGTFMLAERTLEHERLFANGVEAEYFDSDSADELIKKVNYFLLNPIEREHIASNGRKRCLESGYSHHDRLNEMFDLI